MKNLFILAFGQRLARFITRINQTEEIIDTFIDERPSSIVKTKSFQNRRGFI